MSSETENTLPADVVEAIRLDKKILAIKILRNKRKLDLRTAKETVEAYIEGHPDLAARRRVKVKTGLGSVIWFVVLLLAAYAAHRLFFSG